MAAAMDSQAMDLLSATIEDEKKTVTYRWLSRSMGVNVNVAKQWMQSYLESGKQDTISATYYVSWADPATGHQSVALVNLQGLEEKKSSRQTLGYHIYSLEPAPLPDKELLLTAANAEARQLEEGKDINMYRCLQNNRITKSATTAIRKPPTRPVAAAAPSTVPAKAAAQPGLSGSKPGLTSASSDADAALAHKPMENRPTPTTGKPTKAAAPGTLANFFNRAPVKKDSDKTESTSTPGSTKSPVSVAKRNIFDQLQAQQPKRKADEMNDSNNAAMTIDKNPEETNKKVEEDEVDSEEERDRRLARLSRKIGSSVSSSSGVESTKAANSKEEEPADLEAIRKKRRSAKQLALEDDDEDDEEDEVHSPSNRSKRMTSIVNGGDEEDDEEHVTTRTHHQGAEEDDEEKEAHRLALENMMLMDDEHVTPAQASAQPVNIMGEDEDMPMADPEPTPAAPVASFTSTISADGKTRRRRGVRPVTKRKTFMNDRGYMVTKMVTEMEEFSEEEALPPPPPVKAPAPALEPAAATERGEHTSATNGKIDNKNNSAGAAAGGGAIKKKTGGNQSLLNFFSKK